MNLDYSNALIGGGEHRCIVECDVVVCALALLTSVVSVVQVFSFTTPTPRIHVGAASLLVSCLTLRRQTSGSAQAQILSLAENPAPHIDTLLTPKHASAAV
jgi:hypothetical protein